MQRRSIERPQPRHEQFLLPRHRRGDEMLRRFIHPQHLRQLRACLAVITPSPLWIGAMGGPIGADHAGTASKDYQNDSLHMISTSNPTVAPLEKSGPWQLKCSTRPAVADG